MNDRSPQLSKKKGVVTCWFAEMLKNLRHWAAPTVTLTAKLLSAGVCLLRQLAFESGYRSGIRKLLSAGKAAKPIISPKAPEDDSRPITCRDSYG